ncbi:MAG TPA: ATP-binding cassette domain-containing protein [Hyphomicrobiales bacterium]|nr:ATP-binding cassette domain-containing protein [Hyphomicrobiales bacterium]
MAALAIHDLSVRWQGESLVDALSLTLEPGRALTILGESGSGKSLIAQAIMGILPAQLQAGGDIRVGGHSSRIQDGAARRALWGSKLALLPQEPWSALDPTMRVGWQLAETYHQVGQVPRGQAGGRARETLQALGLPHSHDAWPHTLSGGMGQRVVFALSTAGGAPLMLADEPTKGLDLPLRDDMVMRLQAVLHKGGSVLTITHDVSVAQALGGDVIVLLDGKVVERGRAEKVLQEPSADYTRQLLAAMPEHWPARKPPACAGAPLLRLRGVAKQYGGNQLFAGADLDIGAAERLSLWGPSGSGKSTFGDIALGIRRPDAGSVRRREDIGPFGLQKLYQNPLMSFAPRRTLRQSMQDLIRRHALPAAELQEFMQRLRLGQGLLERLPHEVSGGELQRLALARVLLLKPALIFADEPTSRLDLISQRNTLELLIDTAESSGAALLLVTHDPHIARALGGRQLRFPWRETQAAEEGVRGPIDRG